MLALALNHVHDHCARWPDVVALRRRPYQVQPVTVCPSSFTLRPEAFLGLWGRGAEGIYMRHGREFGTWVKVLQELEPHLGSLHGALNFHFSVQAKTSSLTDLSGAYM